MQFLETAFYFVVTLGVLVLVHELGHFLAAKLFKMRVDRFSIGFPPRAFGKKSVKRITVSHGFRSADS